MFISRKEKTFACTILSVLLTISPVAGLVASSNCCPSKEASIVTTEAGDINFERLKGVKEYHNLFQSIKSFSEDDRSIILENGSKWQVSNFDCVKGWDKFTHLIIAQNQAVFSTYKYALLNLDLQSAVPISLVTPPTPNEDIRFINSIDYTHDVIELNNGMIFSVHSNDHGTLSHFHFHNPVMLGANISDQDCSNPLLVIDVSLNSNEYVRATGKPVPEK